MNERKNVAEIRVRNTIRKIQPVIQKKFSAHPIKRLMIQLLRTMEFEISPNIIINRFGSFFFKF